MTPGARRVALVGNMNNNHFALLRYLRDLGVDAHLLMYSNEAEHFYPQHDTWDWERWSPYVRQLSFSNGGHDSLVVSRARLERELGGFDFYIANGIAPVLFDRLRRPLDLFIPYAEGIEFIIEHHWRWGHPLSSGYSLLRRSLMSRAIPRTARVVISPNLHEHAQRSFRELGIEPVILPVPVLYVEPAPSESSLPKPLRDAIAVLSRSDLVVFSHVSHIWKTLPVPHFMGGVGKRNNWLVEGFADYVKAGKRAGALLVLFEYGRDVNETKALVRARGIESQVLWLPVMSRREILCLLPHVDVGGSEFAGMMWGSCGWEFLASGVPMLHQLGNLAEYAAGDTPLAPFFNVQGPREIADVLARNDRAALRALGAAGREWFTRYQGYELARRYVRLINGEKP